MALLPTLVILFISVRVSTALQASYSTGNFTVAYSEASGVAVFNVYDVNDTLVWFTSPRRSPFEASLVEQEISQNGGIFNIKSKVLNRCKDSQIDKHEVLPGKQYPEILFSGTLCSTSAFTFALEATDVKDSSAPGSGVYQHLTFNFTVHGSKLNQVSLVYGCEKEEGFYGFGFQYTKFNVKGHRLPLFSTEQGVGRGLEPVTAILDVASRGSGGTWYTTYTHVPHYISSKFRSLMLHSLEYTVFDFTESDVVSVEVNSTVVLGRILQGGSPLEQVTSYTALVGRMAPLPSWTYKGAVLGLEGGTAAVAQSLAQLRASLGGLQDVAAVWLQDWTGERRFNNSGHDIGRVGLWWNWELDETHYPNWHELVTNLTNENVRVLLYINCLLTDISQRGTPYKRNLYKEGLQNGYLVKLANGQPWEGYSQGYMVDLTNPEAYKWMVAVVQKEMLSINASGWMADFGESLPLDAQLYSGADPSSLHSEYPRMWAQLNAAAVDSFNYSRNSRENSNSASEVVFFMRSASTLSPSHSRLFWAGDQLVTWDHFDGLQTVILAMLSGGLSGLAMVHSDIGGYTTLDVSVLKYVRTKELFMRWTELAAFTPFLRTHPGSLPSANWQFDSDAETREHFFKMVRVFKAWGFYREQLMQEAYTRGWPIVRHMMLVYPSNPKVYREDLSKQYMLGSELLVAPNCRKHSYFVDVFLPAGEHWINVWTNATFLGGDAFMSVPAPMGQPCVLFKSGSVVGKQFQANLHQLRWHN